MSIEQKQFESMEAFRTFNQAITTVRLYPAKSPQVTSAIEKSYQTLKGCARKFTEISYSNTSVGPLLCGAEMPAELGAEFEKFIIFRHLQLLDLKHVVFRPAFDRNLFNNIISVFASRKDDINREGGGRPFVDGLGLKQIFPDYYQGAADKQSTPEKSSDLLQLSKSVPDGVLGYLIREHERDELLAKSRKIFPSNERATEVIFAGIARILDHLSALYLDDKRVISISFTRFIENCETLLLEETREVVASAVADSLMGKLNKDMMVLLFVQNYPAGLGDNLFNLFVAKMADVRFRETIALLRELSTRFKQQKAANAAQAKLFSAALDKLLATNKGKQFLGREKAQSLLESGEEERREKRVVAGVKSLLSGNTETFNNDEFVLGLPSALNKMLKSGSSEDVFRVVELLTAEIHARDDHDKQRLIHCLVLIAEQLIANDLWDLLEEMSGNLLSWIEEFDTADSLYEKSVTVLQALMTYGWYNDKRQNADQILKTFHKIRSGSLETSPPCIAIIGRVQDRTYDRELLESFLEAYLIKPKDSLEGNRLVMMGRSAGSFLVDRLLVEQKTSNRLNIIGLLEEMGDIALPVVIERIQEPMPWFGKRNLVTLTTRIGGPEHVQMILPLLKHDDIRVQREAFVCIHSISGDHRKKALLQCLNICSEAMRCDVVKAMRPYSDSECAQHLSVLLTDQEHYSEENRQPLVLEILEVLSRSRSIEGKNALTQFLSSKKKKANRNLSEIVWKIASAGLKQLETLIGSQDSTIHSVPQAETKAEMDEMSSSASQAGEEVAAVQLPQDYSELPGADQVNEFLFQGKNELAKEALVKIIGKMARERKFEAAERLREWLIEIDPMALSEIIRAAEIIEQEKVSSIDQSDVEAWSELYDLLSTEEFATLYHGMRRKSYKSDEYIVRQGSKEPNLYFVTSGKIKIFFQDERGEILVKTARCGDVFGAETVFDSTVWTVNAACLTKAEVLILGVDQLLTWRTELPSLESRLIDFCLKLKDDQVFSTQGSKDRRRAERHKVSGRVSSLLLDDNGSLTGIASKGELVDISEGGVSFLLRVSQKKNARLLLGRAVRVQIPIELTVRDQLEIDGEIIAVCSPKSLENEFSIHVNFREKLPKDMLESICKAGQEKTVQ